MAKRRREWARHGPVVEERSLGEGVANDDAVGVERDVACDGKCDR